MVALIALPARRVAASYVAPAPAEPVSYTLTDGAVVSLDRAVVVVASLGLEECAGSGLGISDRLRSVLGVAPVLAGHSAEAPPGSVRGPIVIGLVDSGQTSRPGQQTGVRLGTGVAEAWTFCRGHLALGQSAADANGGLQGLDGDDLSGLSLRLEGTLTMSGSVEPFVVVSSRPFGAFVPLTPPLRITDRRELILSFDLQRALADLDPRHPMAGDRAVESLAATASLNT